MAAELRIFNPNPNLGPSGFVFGPENGVKVSQFDPGFPEIRDVVDARPDMHGMSDYTQYFGARSVAINFMIYDGWATNGQSRRQIIDILNGLCNPQLRPFLYESIDGVAERRILLRPNSTSIPFLRPRSNEAQMQFRCPDGFWESAQPIIWELGSSSGSLTGDGRVYNLTYNRTYPARAPSSGGGTTVTNGGNIEAYPVIQIYGPANNATIGNTSQNKKLIFNNIALAASEFIQIDTRLRTILRNGDINSSMYQFVDWTQSEWFGLNPGPNTINFLPTDYAAGTKVVLTFRNPYI